MNVLKSLLAISAVLLSVQPYASAGREGGGGRPQWSPTNFMVIKVKPTAIQAETTKTVHQVRSALGSLIADGSILKLLINTNTQEADFDACVRLYWNDQFTALQSKMAAVKVEPTAILTLMPVTKCDLEEFANNLNTPNPGDIMN